MQSISLVFADEDSSTETEISGFASLGSQTIYTFDLTQDPEEGLEFERSDTIESLMENVNIAYELGLIKNNGIKTSLIQKLKNAQKEKDKGNIDKTKKHLENFIKEVESKRGKHITEEAVNIFISVVSYLTE